jgi:hypothetical protein
MSQMPKRRMIESLSILILINSILFNCTSMKNQPSKEPDYFSMLIDHLSPTMGLWKNGGFASISLPKTASTTTVVDEVFQKSSFEEGRVTHYSIKKTKDVVIPPDPTSDSYTAVLTETNLGKQIVLLQYVDESTGWWSRIFPVAELQTNR